VAYYPVFLELADQPCVVIGGGTVAERKVAGLCAARAVVTVVSPVLTPLLEQWVKEETIRHVPRTYRPGDLTGFRLAFAATGDSAVDAAVHQEGLARGVWVNAVDDPTHCDFILPAVVRRSHLTVAVATGGKSPALTRMIRDEINAYFDADYALLSEVAAEARQRLRACGRRATAERWVGSLKDNSFRRLVRDGHRERAIIQLLGQLGEENETR
jgi:siroheme synthase-like protein